MEFVADLHLHSKYSRAVSKNMTLAVMAQMASRKGLDVLTAADWTHPLWFKEIQSQLEEAGEGLYKLKERREGLAREVLFLLSTEIASIYKQGDKLRRIHNLVFVPSLEVAGRVSKELLKRGCNLSADGRPIVGLTSKNLLELILTIDERCMLIPCHIWTPHFGMYGSASGFDSIEESFGSLGKYVYGIETGISSDPDMNWQVRELQDRSILSFSDAHSPAKMGREATVFRVKDKNLKVSYDDFRRAIMRDEGGGLEIAYTVEFYPEEGKYHYSGHRNCKYVAGVEELRVNGEICPVCRRKVTEGVFFRAGQLADSELAGRVEVKGDDQGLQWFADRLGLQPPYVKLVPLLEIAAEALSYASVASKRVQGVYAELCNRVGSEMDILLRASVEEIAKVGGERVAEGVARVRRGDIVIHPGYDGEYGKVRIWPEEGKKERQAKVDEKGQLGLDI
jgi:uncharacterized protein (TIGR00375 family)